MDDYENGYSDREYGRGIDRYQPLKQGVASGVSKIVVWVGAGVVMALLALIGLGIWSIWSYIWDYRWVAGVIAVGVLLYVLILGLWYPLIALRRWARRKQFISVGQYGGYFDDGVKVTPVSPLNAITPKQSMRANTSLDEIVIPPLAELLPDGQLLEGNSVLYGYRQDGTPRYGPYQAGTVGIGGKGEVGKSVTMMIRIIIALMLGWRVTICDPHKHKDRSIWKKLEPLTPWIEWAFSKEEILAAAEQFSGELDQRKAGVQLAPHLIVYDEFKSIVKHSPEICKEVVKSVEIASDEGMGFGMGCLLACHGWTEDSIGDVAVRNALKHVYQHNMDPAQAKYVLNDRRFASKSDKLKKGHTYYRDDEGDIEYLIQPFGTVDDAKLAAGILERMGIAKCLNSGQPRGYSAAPRPRSPMPDMPEKESYEDGDDEDFDEDEEGEAHDATFYASPTKPLNEYDRSRTGPLQVPVNEAVHSVNGLGKTREVAFANETSPDEDARQVKVSPEEETLILVTAMRLQVKLLAEGKKLTRTALRDELGWNNKQYPKIMVMCDKYSIC